MGSRKSAHFLKRRRMLPIAYSSLSYSRKIMATVEPLIPGTMTARPMNRPRTAAFNRFPAVRVRQRRFVRALRRVLLRRDAVMHFVAHSAARRRLLYPAARHGERKFHAQLFHEAAAALVVGRRHRLHVFQFKLAERERQHFFRRLGHQAFVLIFPRDYPAYRRAAVFCQNEVYAAYPAAGAFEHDGEVVVGHRVGGVLRDDLAQVSARVLLRVRTERHKARFVFVGRVCVHVGEIALFRESQDEPFGFKPYIFHNRYK